MQYKINHFSSCVKLKHDHIIFSWRSSGRFRAIQWVQRLLRGRNTISCARVYHQRRKLQPNPDKRLLLGSHHRNTTLRWLPRLRLASYVTVIKHSVILISYLMFRWFRVSRWPDVSVVTSRIRRLYIRHWSTKCKNKARFPLTRVRLWLFRRGR